MPDRKQTTLVLMPTGRSGVVVQIRGGTIMVSRLSAMGIRPGKRIIKSSAMFMRGPVTVQVDRAQLAIGYGMASRIMVALD